MVGGFNWQHGDFNRPPIPMKKPPNLPSPPPPESLAADFNHAGHACLVDFGKEVLLSAYMGMLRILAHKMNLTQANANKVALHQPSLLITLGLTGPDVIMYCMIA
uniref:Uncharacterized protein n=1 Tax=Arundo donax TaxID=35708 RepID=A0A0A8YG28_ARUDO